ncbi:glycosyltransferase [Erythrobacter alti]|uniref:glycosyltransferase n=1 Tax=Erythrobacter alti TaxID=1896145 RepID=UPI0030F3A8E2
MQYSPGDFCVIAAVDDDAVLEQCLARSPDIADGTLRLITLRNAKSMAQAYNDGLGQTSATICIFAHQDVYLPLGWLDRTVKVLSDLSNSHPDWLVCGPYGVRKNGNHVGRVWDVNMGRELGEAGFAPTAVESLDELLLILRREPQFRFDSKLPHFHLYGTDLVQTAWTTGHSALAVELPVVHNNRPWASLGGGYVDAYRYAVRKWRKRLPVFTTVCELSRNPLPLLRVRWRRRHINSRGEGLLGDAKSVACEAGYEREK